MIVKLHPTLKACSCGFIGVRATLYKHIDNELTRFKERANREPHVNSFWRSHGEIPLNENDPRASLVLTPQQIIDSL